MPRFFYKAKNDKGKTEAGTLEVADERALAKTLKEQGRFLIWAEPEEKALKKKVKIASYFKRISLVDKIMFTRNLQVMVSAGVPIPKALDILTSQAESQKFKKIIQDLKNSIVKGEKLSFALKKHPSVFPSLFSNMILAGEESGSMVDSLAVLTEQMEKEYDLKNKIKGALIYPIIIVSAMLGIGSLMMIMVIPMIADTFEQLEVDLPLTTRIIIAVGVFFANYWYLFFLFLVVFVLTLRAVFKTKKGKSVKDKLLLKTPIISGLIKKINLAYFCRTLSSLIASGVSMVKALDLVSLSINNVFYKEAIQKSKKEIQKGTKLAESLDRNDDIFPILVVQMIQVGEETGETVSLLRKLAEFYEEESANITKNMSTLIEPVLMLIIGAAVAFFAVSIIQPIYSMLGAI